MSENKQSIILFIFIASIGLLIYDLYKRPFIIDFKLDHHYDYAPEFGANGHHEDSPPWGNMP